MPHLEVWFDMRRPGFSSVSTEAMYGAMLDQCEWADRMGFDAVTLGEHHGAEDGYLPSPVVLAASVAGRTASLRVRMILLAPFYDPLRLAEDLTVLNLASGGRAFPVIVAGYRPAEFDMYGISRENRRAQVEETLRVLRAVWNGQEFEYRGRKVKITPTISATTPLITGGSVKSIARRAAHIADGFRGGDHILYEEFRSERMRLGYPDPGPYPTFGPDFLFVTDDPDRAWPILAPHLMHSSNSYSQWAAEAAQAPPGRFPLATTIEDLKSRPNAYRVVTPVECIELANELGPNGILRLQPLAGGLHPDVAWSSLTLFEKSVLPNIEVNRAEVLRY